MSLLFRVCERTHFISVAEFNIAHSVGPCHIRCFFLYHYILVAVLHCQLWCRLRHLHPDHLYGAWICPRDTYHIGPRVFLSPSYIFFYSLCVRWIRDAGLTLGTGMQDGGKVSIQIGCSIHVSVIEDFRNLTLLILNKKSLPLISIVMRNLLHRVRQRNLANQHLTNHSLFHHFSTNTMSSFFVKITCDFLGLVTRGTYQNHFR